MPSSRRRTTLPFCKMSSPLPSSSILPIGCRTWETLSLGDKIQILGTLCPNFLRALSATVDAKFAELDAAAVRRKA